MVGTTTKPEGESSSVLPVAAVAVTLGTLGLLAWARSSKRGPWRSTARASSKPSPKWEGNVARGGEGEKARSFGDRVIVVGPFGAGARARVYGRGDWDAAVSGTTTLPEPLYEVCRMSAEAAQLAAMAHVRGMAKEREES